MIPVPARIKQAALIFKDAFQQWNAKDPFRESAVIAYYAIFSLPGLLVIFLASAGYFWGKDAASQHLHSQVSQAMGSETADQVQEIMQRVSRSRASLAATVGGLAAVLFGATGVFVQLQKSLNIIWEVRAKPSRSGLWDFLKGRLFSFGLILSIAFLLLVSLAITSLLDVLSRWIRAHWPPYILFLFQSANFLISVAIISVLFALMFKVLPDARIKWRYAWVGAFLTSLLFALGKFALGLYFGRASPGSGYGAAGSVILILLWVSYSSMIVFYGAEVTKAYADRYHGYVPAGRHAVKAPGRQR